MYTQGVDRYCILQYSIFIFLRMSYNGYYPSLPSWRRGFDSLHPLCYIIHFPASLHSNFLFLSILIQQFFMFFNISHTLVLLLRDG